MPQVANRVRENTTTTGTGPVTVGGAPSSQYRTFASANLTQSFPYYINDSNGNWEEGRGTFSSGTVTRAIVEDSSAGPGKPISLSGTAVIGIDLNAGAMNDLFGEPSAVPPNAFPNLVLWLDAANATPSQWTDTSGLGNHATQATTANQPTITSSAINGLPAVSFNGSSQYYNSPYLGELGTVIIICKATANFNGVAGVMGATSSTTGVYAAYQVQPCGTSATTPFRRVARGTTQDVAGVTSWVANSSPCTGVWDVFGFRNDGEALTLYNGAHQCGSPTASPNAVTVSAAAAIIGGDYYNGTMQDWWNGEIAEIIVYSSALTTQQYAQVVGWVHQKYAISEPVGTYLWSCFNGNGTNEHGANCSLCLLTSDDGINWSHRPSTYMPVSGIAVRDISTVYYGGALWIVHTASNASVSNYFVVAKSTDGFNFEFVANVDCSAVAGATSNSRCWAPDFFIDSDGSVHVTVACTSNFSTWYICELHPTNDDWTQWSAPVEFTTPGSTSSKRWVIDPFMSKVGGTYYLWVADATTSGATEAIVYYTSSTLFGTYTAGPTGNWAGFGEPMEGMSLVNTGPTDWTIYFDADGTGYSYSNSTDNYSTWSAPVAVNAPFIPQHGTVIRMPQSFFNQG